MSIKGLVNVFGMVCFLSASAAFSGTMGAESDPSSFGSIYISAFGGGTTVSSGNLSQQGTAYYDAAKGGPLAVNARGESKQTSAGVVGGHVGYQWPARSLTQMSSNWTFSPATELEGYYLGGRYLSWG